MSAASLYASPLFEPLQRWLERLPLRPDAQAVAQLAMQFPIHAENGQRIRFVPPQPDGLVYECRIWESGEVETRPDNWHDFFNALVWLSFPKTKIAVSAAHMRAMQAPGEKRTNSRDVLTHFDECGIVVLSSRPELLDLLRGFCWKELFVERRTEVISSMRFVIFGHATYEQLLKPFRGLTAKAVLYEVSEDWLLMSTEAQVAAVDTLLAVDLTSGKYNRPRDFQPLPLLGIPGVTPESENPDYYDDTWQFRPGRRAKD
uniref:Putative transmembrane protein n=1 Tax=Dechloromonas aromatica (strain RCB) TaxID=159087 RepID=Q47IR6_DECAR